MTLEYFESLRSFCTVPLWKIKLFISKSCSILVLTTVRSRPVTLMLKSVLKTIRGQLLSEKMLFENRWLWSKFVSVLEPRLTSNAGLRISIYSNPSYFYMCNFVSGDKFRFAWSHETKFHIQKCNTCRNIEIQSHQIKFCNSTVHAYQYSAILNLVHQECHTSRSTCSNVPVLLNLVLNLVRVLLDWNE